MVRFDSDGSALEPCKDCILTIINVSQVVPDPEPNWRFTLESMDGTSWTIERRLTEKQAIERAREFSRFSGLPMFVHGQEW